MEASEPTHRRLERKRKPGLPCDFMLHTSLGSGEEKLGEKQNQGEGRSPCRGCKVGRHCRPALTPDSNPDTKRDGRTCCEPAVKAFTVQNNESPLRRSRAVLEHKLSLPRHPGLRTSHNQRTFLPLPWGPDPRCFNVRYSFTFLLFVEPYGCL